MRRQTLKEVVGTAMGQERIPRLIRVEYRYTKVGNLWNLVANGRIVSSSREESDLPSEYWRFEYDFSATGGLTIEKNWDR